MILIQNLKHLSPVIHNNADYLYITTLKEYSIKAAFELSRGFETEKQFKTFMNSVNKEEYRAVRFNLKGGKDKYYVFQGQLCPPFQLSF